MKETDRFAGSYAGSGTWHDSTGTSSGYRIVQTNRVTDDGLEVSFKHDFDDGSVVEARIGLIRIAPFVFRAEINGSPVGNGYIFGGYCHYHMKVGEAFVEASYRLTDEGIDVFGSSTKNAAGDYIAWRESLLRQEISS